MWQQWVCGLSTTDKTNIVCFIITMLVSVIGMLILVKLKTLLKETWKTQISCIVFLDVIGVLILIYRLANG